MQAMGTKYLVPRRVKALLQTCGKACSKQLIINLTKLPCGGLVINRKLSTSDRQ